jgi:hypothetical protein
MANSRTIWNYEVKKANKIAGRLLENNRVKAGWRILLLPFFLLDYFRFKKNLWVTRKNLLFTKQLLLDHYLGLLNSNRSDYDGMTKVSYQTRGKYLSFIDTLQKAEKEVIQAAVTTMRKRSKSDRRQWFEQVKETTKKAHLAEVNRIFPGA